MAKFKKGDRVRLLPRKKVSISGRSQEYLGGMTIDEEGSRYPYVLLDDGRKGIAHDDDLELIEPTLEFEECQFSDVKVGEVFIGANRPEYIMKTFTPSGVYAGVQLDGEFAGVFSSNYNVKRVKNLNVLDSLTKLLKRLAPIP